MITDSKAKKLMLENFVNMGEYLYIDNKFICQDDYNRLYKYLQEKYCKECKFEDHCDWTPPKCPLIRHKYGDNLDEIENFDPETFDPIKYYWGEPQNETSNT